MHCLQVPEIDLVAGGHNHDYFVRTIGRTKVLNSGTDFQDLSEINVQLGANAAPLVAVTRSARAQQHQQQWYDG